MRRAVKFGVALVFVIGASGCGKSSASPPLLHVSAAEMAFTPSALTASAGTTVIAIRNRGTITHTFSVNALDEEVTLNPGKTKTLTVNAPKGAYPYVCRILDHEGLGMHGVLTIT